MAEKDDVQKKTSIGGQALIEGIMMRGPETTSMAVRHTSGDIVLEQWPTKGKERASLWKAPFIRGIFNFIDSMVVGYKCLMRSAELAGLEDDDPPEAGEDSPEKPKKEEGFFSKFGMTLLMTLSAVLGVALAVGLFLWLPSVLFNLLCIPFPALDNTTVWRAVFEGVLRIVLFVAYIAVVSLMKDIRRVFMYHGAEHKCIFCYEKGEALTVENVRRQIRFHPRCGTSFLILMLIVGIVISMFIPIRIPLLRTAVKLLTIPLVVGIGYELIKLAGRSDSPVVRFISAPGLWMQRITTKEPTDDMIEVAIKALEAVIPEDPDADRL